ncbi:MAG TPA: NfeD family protein [Gaiellaceae bacterium]|nr:NfeD family protein [Gaiellaceae bacterium]
MLFVGAVLLAIFVAPAPWGLVLVAASAVVEVAETYFWIRFSRRRRIQAGAETLIGARAVVVSPCRPAGQVRVQGELWRARCEPGAEPGETVRIVGREGLTLLVEPE